MNKGLLYAVLAVGALLFTGCNDELNFDKVQAVEKHFGEEIVFGGSASYSLSDKKSAATRTIYGGYENIEDGAEPVYWVTTDSVRLYCKEASLKSADYVVASANGTNEFTGLNKVGEAGLQWGNPDNTHTFYGVYPIPDNNSLKEGTALTGTIPAVQVPTGNTKVGNNTTFSPDMRNAYMVARTSVNPNSIGGNVYLKFMPIATAVEVTLINNSGVTLDFNNVLLRSKTATLNGEFNVNWSENITNGEELKEGEDVVAIYDNAIPEINVNKNVAFGNYVSIPLYANGLLGDPTKVENGSSITFTAFMLPIEDISDLEIVIQTVQGIKTGKTQNVTVNVSKKNFLRNLKLEATTYSQANWIKFVDDKAYVSQLSIPGAGGAASGNLTGDNTTDKYRQQDLNINQLWNHGVRCFEFSVDIATNTEDANGNITEYGDISGNQVLCNGHPCNTTLTQAITDVKKRLEEHSDEFAMVILTYQTQGGYDERDPHSFMKQINDFWAKVADGTACEKWENGCRTNLYKPQTATVGNSRGSLFCIARPSSIYQDYGDEIVIGLSDFNWDSYEGTVKVASKNYDELNIEDPHKDILVIKGWGALKDKWQQRGFTRESQRGTNNKHDDDRPGRPFDCSENVWSGTGITIANYAINTDDLTPDFSYGVIDVDGDNTEAWVQEWARVSKMTSAYAYSSGWITSNYIYWAASKNEKIQRIKECLNYAIAGKVTGHENTSFSMFINSLCGYYIDTKIEQSYIPCTLTDWNANKGNATDGFNQLSLESDEGQTAGMYGDIATFASEMNEEFYKYLQAVTSGYVPGSLGIILMDRVGVAESSQKIPSIIVANNFQFDMDQDVTPASFALPRDEYTGGDQLAAPAQRGVKPANGEATIVWE